MVSAALAVKLTVSSQVVRSVSVRFTMISVRSEKPIRALHPVSQNFPKVAFPPEMSVEWDVVCVEWSGMSFVWSGVGCRWCGVGCGVGCR